MWTFEETDYIKRILSPAVDSFKKSGCLPDYFERYDLPLEVTNPKEIEEAITIVHGFWNKSKQNTRFKELLSVLLAPKEQQDAKRSLVNDTLRQVLREEVASERKKRQEARFAALDKSIRVVASKGYITPSEQTALLKQYTNEGLAEQDIRSRVKVPIREAVVRLPADEGLSKTVREQINSSLGVVRKRDLYEFLQVDQGCSRDRLAERYRETEMKWRAKPSDFNKTAAQTLLGVIKKYLIDGDPDKYKAALAYDAVEALEKEVKVTSGDKRITKSEFDQLLATAVEAPYRLKKETATEYILALAEKYGASVEWTIDEDKDQVRCANCSTLIPLKRKPENCAICGEPLWGICPKCTTRVPLSHSACDQCGFKTDALPHVRLLTRRAEVELEDGHVEDAFLTAKEAEMLWGRSGDVARILAKIEAVLERVKKLRRDFDEALAVNKLFAARTLLNSIRAVAPNYIGLDRKDLTQLKDGVDGKIKQCEMLLAAAREHERKGRLNDAIFAYQDLLHIAADADEARKGLNGCPPQPPTNVRAENHDGQVIVEWSASVAVGHIEYLVVRAEREATCLEDGEVLAKIGSTSFLDQKARAASHLFYTVFAERSGVLSKGVSSRAVLVMHEVRNLNIEAGNAIVKGSWEFDVPEARVRIFREEGHSPSKAGDGREIRPSGPHNFFDREVINGHLYYYRVVVEYRDSAGRPAFTSGIVRSVKPEQPPAALSEFKITLERGVLHVSWSPPKHGSVSFYRTPDRPEWSIGEQIPAAKLASLGVPLRSEFNNLAVDFAPLDKPAFYVPVTVAGDVAVIGCARRYVTTQDVSQLKAKDFGRYLVLQWRWPQDCRLAFVAWRHDAYPLDVHDVNAVTRRISRGEYESQGGFRVEDPVKETYYFVVFAASQVEGEYMHSSGVSPGSRAVVRTNFPLTISYSISRGNWFHRNRITITLSAENEVKHLPEIAVIAKRGDIQPLRINDGILIATLSGLSLEAKSSVSHEFILDSVRRPCYLRAFFRRGSSRHSFRLIDPPAEQLRIN